MCTKYALKISVRLKPLRSKCRGFLLCRHFSISYNKSLTRTKNSKLLFGLSEPQERPRSASHTRNARPIKGKYQEKASRGFLECSDNRMCNMHISEGFIPSVCSRSIKECWDVHRMCLYYYKIIYTSCTSCTYLHILTESYVHPMHILIFTRAWLSYDLKLWGKTVQV